MVNYLLPYCLEAFTFGPAIVLGVVVAVTCGSVADSFVTATWAVVGTVAAASAAFLTGFVVLCFFGPTIHNAASRLNGSPFKAGDHVRILAGLRRGEILEVNEVWDERGTVYGKVPSRDELIEVAQTRVCSSNTHER